MGKTIYNLKCKFCGVATGGFGAIDPNDLMGQKTEVYCEPCSREVMPGQQPGTDKAVLDRLVAAHIAAVMGRRNALGKGI